MSRTRLPLVVSLLSVYLIWGSTFLAIQIMSTSLPPFISSGLRFALAGFILISWKLIEKKGVPSWQHIKTAALKGFLLLFLSHGTVIYALQFMPSGLSNVIFSTVPFWLIILSAFIGREKKISTPKIFGLLTGVAGMIVLINPFSGGRDFNMLGVLLLVGAALLWAVGSLFGSKAESHPSVGMAAGLMMTFGGLFLTAAGVITGEAGKIDFSAMNSDSILAFLYLLVFGSIFGFTAFNWLMKNASTALLGTHTYVNPLVAVLLGVAIAGETLTLNQAAGGAFILVSLVLITRQDRVIESKSRNSELAIQENC
jgi:drug/metabolite transporter (DMT)-like permease